MVVPTNQCSFSIPSPISKFGVKGMRYDFPKPIDVQKNNFIKT
jgi:hypothetical protein